MRVLGTSLSGWEQYPIAALVLMVGAWVLRWTDRHQRVWLETARSNIASLEKDVKELQEQNALCEWRTEILLGVCRKAGLTVPASYWTGPGPEFG